MPVPPSGPLRRVPVPRRAPVRAQPRRSSSSAGPWLALLGLLAVAGSVAGGVWLMKNRTTSPAPSPTAASLPAPPAGVAEPAEPPTPAVVSPEQVQQAVAEAPLLAPGAARALLTEAARRGQVPGHALDSALHIASVGFADLDRATLDELGDLFARSWSARPARDQGRIQAYLQYARSGEPLSPEAVTAGRTLFVESVRALPAASQGRLTAAFGKAVATGIAYQQQAEERARVAALTPLPPAEAPPPALADDLPESAQARDHTSRWPTTSATSPVAAPASGEPSAESDAGDRGSRGRSESYWRSRAAGARSAVESAEKRVRDLEEQATRGGPVVPGPLPPACQAGVRYNPAGLSPVKLRDESRNAVSCDSEILRQQGARNTQNQLDAARESLTRAQKALDALEDEARRAGALPGWLR